MDGIGINEQIIDSVYGLVWSSVVYAVWNSVYASVWDAVDDIIQEYGWK